MIGIMDIDEPQWPEATELMVKSHMENIGQPLEAILMFGLWGVPEYSPEVRLYAGYKHLQQKPDNGAPWLELASVHREMKEFDKAEKILRELGKAGGFDLIPQVYCENLDAHLAHTLAAAGKLKEALAIMDVLEKDFSGLPTYLYARASMQHEMGNFAEASAIYEKAVAIIKQHEQEDDGPDLKAAEDYIGKRKKQADEGRKFEGIRPLDLGQLFEAEAE